MEVAWWWLSVSFPNWIFHQWIFHRGVERCWNSDVIGQWFNTCLSNQQQPNRQVSCPIKKHIRHPVKKTSTEEIPVIPRFKLLQEPPRYLSPLNCIYGIGRSSMMVERDRFLGDGRRGEDARKHKLTKWKAPHGSMRVKGNGKKNKCWCRGNMCWLAKKDFCELHSIALPQRPYVCLSKLKLNYIELNFHSEVQIQFQSNWIHNIQ